ncbi:succinylglutamate desuccinylase/aspartoacylase domain-containing protein [Ramlibacter albus]|uniref:Succinylglutamate desuccinylase/aspartoacylase family protein n=1 Tax=Ramlibacter albus TaxID=2079448 RepID=A0A923M5R8_9BURK|nr:succinylglutamate desuccinylase/aspartoacylase family protein [Ramlibacter albus]MBC5763329.1 succinylglutamate desuccinylase/aspartoacylase family protein [Ramlibacter albus]
MQYELLPQDLSAYRAGNTGIPYVHRFESGKPGPHVLVNALTHGNEFCGVEAARHLLDNSVRPRIGTLTVSFANVEAYESFDPEKPAASRMVVHNLNRIWGADMLDGSLDSPDLRRARELRPVVAAADHVLDIHSTLRKTGPFWAYPRQGTNEKVAHALGFPPVHMVYTPGQLGTGVALVEYEAHKHPGSARLVVECGQHFERESGETAKRVTLSFLAYFGLVDALVARPAEPQRPYEVVSVMVVKTPAFRFARPVEPLDVFAAGELIATDGDIEHRAPVDGCTIFMPAREPIVGREAGWLTRPA